MRVLYQFPLSHYCEKARWLLDHKELDYVAHNLIPGFHRAFTYLKSGQNYLPMLKDDKQWIADSTQIALYLDSTYPEHALLRRDEQLREQAIEIDKLANELGVHVRRWSLAQALSTSDHPLEIMMGEQGYLRQFEKFSKPILKSLVASNYQLNPEKVAHSKVRMTELITELNQRLIDNQGRYLVGDRLGLADISVCSMLAPLLVMKGTPWELENDDVDQFGGELKEYYDYLLDLPLGQYVQRIYSTERNARVDWRGI
ncbi:glutathione S-transferase family protein [Acinetobacter suaedae]|uniref:Glutathione S-transferase family protein n=1 Tax=Acinetobacter suaedae TaxID=2609668 RepID=A0A5P1UTK6_9GAMM|nr:glutathione S-transferase family protein [Acinetobacter sp. C16S1]QER39463.1 glutathione S-transferase family protein [Acinetobacter sp. C16S1]